MIHWPTKSVVFMMFLLVSISCNEKEIEDREYPRVQTLAVSKISEAGATFNAEILLTGKQQIVEYGFTWGTGDAPRLELSDKISIVKPLNADKFSIDIRSTLKSEVVYSVKAFIKTKDYLVYGPKVEFISLGSGSASIRHFTPERGTWGDTIIINGAGFSFVLLNNQVFFGNKEADVIHSSDSVLTCIVPVNVSGKSVPITVQISDRMCKATNDFLLTVPLIKSFYPSSATFLDTITIKGENLASRYLDKSVFFNDNLAPFVSFSDTMIKVLVPTSLSTQHSLIIVSRNQQADTANHLFSILPPSISELSEPSGDYQSVLTIIGDNFNPDSRGDTLYFETNFAEIIEVDKTKLVVKVPSGIYTKRSFPLRLRISGQETYSATSFTLTNPWIRKKDVPHGKFGRYGATGFSVTGYGYLGTGYGAEDITKSSDFWKYDPANNTWTQIIDFGGGNRYAATSFVIDNYAYMGGGDFGNPDNFYFKDMWRFDPLSETWSSITGLPVMADRIVGLNANGKGYICANLDINNFWEFNVTGSIWERLPDLETLKRGAKGKADAGFVINNKIYIYASGNSTGIHQLYEFDLNSNQWTRKADLPVAGICIGVEAFKLEGKGYIIGSSRLFRYDPEQNKWDTLELVPVSFRGRAVSFTLNGKAYYGSGDDGSSVVNSFDFWEYDPAYQE